MITHEDIRIAVFGLGHVGLPTALGFAELGWDVIGVENGDCWRRSKVC